MAETLATKLGEITKKFKAVNKEVIAKLAEHGEIVKSSTSVITDEQAAMVVDLLTQSNTFTVEEIEGFKADAIKAAEKRIARKRLKPRKRQKHSRLLVRQRRKPKPRRKKRLVRQARLKQRLSVRQRKKKRKKSRKNIIPRQRNRRA